MKFRHHLSDIVRLQILYMNGGIYLDADMVVVRDLEPLLGKLCDILLLLDALILHSLRTAVFFLTRAHMFKV